MELTYCSTNILQMLDGLLRKDENSPTAKQTTIIILSVYRLTVEKKSLGILSASAFINEG